MEPTHSQTPSSLLRQKRALQICVAVLAAIPLGIGAAGVATGTNYLGAAGPTIDLDSHFRYLSGIFMALGVVFYSCVPNIERKSARFGLAAALVFAGGIGRLVALLAMGAPTWPHLSGLGLELGVVPALALWQRRVARRST
jgi:hypothetical protein